MITLNNKNLCNLCFEEIPPGTEEFPHCSLKKNNPPANNNPPENNNAGGDELITPE